MQVRAGVGWQYALADLSLILFMVCAAALSQRPAAKAAPVQAPPRPPEAIALADPVAVWRAGPGAPSLEQWLASQALDSRQRLTLVARYADGQPQAAFIRAEAMMQAERKLPSSTRIVVEPAGVDDLSATLTWDVAGQAVTPASVARPLQ